MPNDMLRPKEELVNQAIEESMAVDKEEVGLEVYMRELRLQKKAVVQKKRKVKEMLNTIKLGREEEIRQCVRALLANQKPSFGELVQKVTYLQTILREENMNEFDIDAKMAALVGESNSPYPLGKHSLKGKALK